MISSQDVGLLLFAVSAGEALAFLLALRAVWSSFDGKLREQAAHFGEKLDELRAKNRELQAQVENLTDLFITNYQPGMRVEAGEDVNIGRDVTGRDRTGA